MDYLALLDKQDWTVDDLTKLPKDLFETDVPFPVTLDLPALTTRRQALLERARERE